MDSPVAVSLSAGASDSSWPYWPITGVVRTSDHGDFDLVEGPVVVSVHLLSYNACDGAVHLVISASIVDYDDWAAFSYSPKPVVCS